MTPEQQRIADRIVKLLAVASSTTFAAEAETARRLAGELMKTHDVRPVAGKPVGSALAYREYIPFAKGMRWEGIIASALGRLSSCMVFFGDDLDCYSLVGTNFNLDVLEYLLQAVNSQRIGAWTSYKASGGPDRFNQFCYGFATALKSKIENLVDHEHVDRTRTALVSWYEQTVLHRAVESGSLAMGAASSDAGKDAGRSASLNRGTVTGGSQKLIGRRP